MDKFRFTEEQLNYFKLAKVVIDEFSKVLRNTFVKLWNSKHGSVQMWDNSPAVLAWLQTLEKPTKTPIPSSPIEEWDCTALTQVTLFSRNFTDPHGNRLCTLVPKLPSGTSFHAPTSGYSWYELALALDQLRLLRNTLCHQSSTTGIDHKSLQHYLRLAKDAFSTLGEDTSVIDAISSMTGKDFPTDEVRRLEVQFDELKELVCVVEEHFLAIQEEFRSVKQEVDKLKEKVQETRKGDFLPPSVLPSAVPNFTGRKRECDEIVRQMTKTDTRIVGVVGSPGFGKTSIAKAVAHQISSSNPDGHIYYVPLQGLKSLESLAKKLLATLTSTSILTSLEKATGNASAIEQLKNFIPDVHHELFLLLDNADKFVESAEFCDILFNLALNCSHLRILYTSRKPIAFCDIIGILSEVVPIKELRREEGADLVELLVPGIPRAHALKLSESCGDVPLALQLLCATLQHDHITVEELLATKHDLFRLLNAPDKLRFQKLFDDSFERLSESSQTNFLLLEVFRGSFDAAAASAVLNVEDGIPIKKALAKLEARSLLEYDEASKRYRLHPLLHSYCHTKVQDKPPEEIQAAYEEATRRFFMHYLGLFQRLNNKYQSDAWQGVVASFLTERGNICEALTQSVQRDEFYDQVTVKISKTSSEFFLEHVLSNREYKDLLSVCLKEADRRNDKTRRSKILSSQLLIRLLLQDFDGYGPFPVSPEEVAGITKGKLLCYKGIFLTNQNKIEEGIELIYKGIREMDGSDEDPIVKSLSLYFLAYIHQRKENHDQAKQCLKKAAEVCLEHGLPKLQIGELDRLSPDIETVQDAVETNEKTEVDQDATNASVSHPLSVQFCTILSLYPVVNGDLDGTLEVLNRRLQVRQNKLGEDARTAKCYREISRILTLKGEPDEALKMGLEALRIFKAVNWLSLEGTEKYSVTAETYYTIGAALRQKGDNTGALKAFCRSGTLTEDLCRRSMMEMESLVHQQSRQAHIYKHIHQVYFEKENWTKSLEAARKALKFSEMSLGSHEETVQSHLDVGKVFQRLDENERALEEYRKAFEMQEKVTEQLEAQQKSAQAAAAALPDTAVEKQVLGRHHDIAELYCKIGLAFSELKDYFGAEKAYSKSQEICRELGLQQNEAQCWYGLGLAHFNSGNFVESLEALKQCLKMYKELGERDEQISDCQDWVKRAEGQVKTLNDSLRAHIQAKKRRDQSLIIHKDTDSHHKDKVTRELVDKRSGTAEKTPSGQQRVSLLEYKTWFWGPMLRQESEAFLLNFGKSGDFLIRESESWMGDCILSVKVPDNVLHFRMKRCIYGSWKIEHDCSGRLGSVLRILRTLIPKNVPLNKPFQYEPQDAETTSADGIKTETSQMEKRQGIEPTSEPNGIKAEASQTEKPEVFEAKQGYYPEMRGDLLLERGDKVTVHEMNPSGWWRGELKGNFGWFPAICVLDYVEGHWRFPFQEKGESRASIEPTTEPNGIKTEALQTEKPEVFVAKDDYYPQMRGELLLERGDEVTVHEMNPSGWWRGELKGTFGWFPAICVMDYTEDTEGTEKTCADNESTELEGISTGVSTTEELTGETFVLKYGHYAENSNELDLERGDEVTVLVKNPDGWWRGKVVEDSGWFPSNCVTPSDAS